MFQKFWFDIVYLARLSSGAAQAHRTVAHKEREEVIDGVRSP